MNRIDRAVIGSLVVLFVLIASLVGLPSVLPGDASRGGGEPIAVRCAAGRGAALPRGHARPRDLGQPTEAHSQADRDLVALVFSGLVRNGPDGTIVPDLARQWTVDSTGAIWTFELRPDARWQDGEPVTAEDVAFTIRTLQDPSYTGPAAGSWQDVTVKTEGALTVVFTLSTPLGGFLQAATQPIAPAHILAGIPVDQLADDPFGRQPIGSGPFALVSLTDDAAELRPAASLLQADAPIASASAAVPDSLTTPGPDGPPGRTRPVPGRHRVPVLRRRRCPGRRVSRRATSTRRRDCRPRRSATSRRRPAAGSCATRARP